jgi:hypothetical protein
MKKVILLLIFNIIALNSQIIDSIAIDVDGEPITTLDIEAVQAKFNLSKKAAIEILIKNRLESGAVERANIEVSPEEIEAEIDRIASSKRISRKDMKLTLFKKGLTWEEYKEQLAMNIKKKKFFAKNILATISKPSDEELKLYYETHKDKFSKAGSIRQVSLILYASNSSKRLQEAIDNPMKMIDGVQRKSMLVNSNEMNPRIFKIIDSTPSGSFTKPINTGRGFVSYFVKSKSNQGEVGFEAVKNSVAMAWMQEERMKASNNFLNKLKDNASIRVIRL